MNALSVHRGMRAYGENCGYTVKGLYHTSVNHLAYHFYLY